jgi:uncharacterized ferredoxin-like protein
MIYSGKNLERNVSFEVAKLMVTAARTAPKARGIDNIETMILDGEEKDRLAAEMRKLGAALDYPIFVRDAGNVDESDYVVLIGVRHSPIGLKSCGACGATDCAAAIQAGINCNFNITDLGIAVGSAVSVAADHRIDNRVMWTIGRTAIQLNFFSKKVRICYGMPLSTHGKSIYYDRPNV